ncbi:uncharacterized protein B0I36DRAFT_14094 [Microdochium trichocladiopsis]|uniref:Uncharacterized protein n=1 Tax=Microdochium trichocladiopsis TaxID=1682393 RepID=A0A9P9BVV5_9PEZI|nr:uncharacterized protein B0I36DRAFT_14094 [Microdochium trichocladiopsis]KAH7040693.1 hypothetical protein B0I36DRAFT_14094 [Microdochium trichocladiopsis]
MCVPLWLSWFQAHLKCSLIRYRGSLQMHCAHCPWNVPWEAYTFHAASCCKSRLRRCRHQVKRRCLCWPGSSSPYGFVQGFLCRGMGLSDDLFLFSFFLFRVFSFSQAGSSVCVVRKADHIDVAVARWEPWTVSCKPAGQPGGAGKAQSFTRGSKRLGARGSHAPASVTTHTQARRHGAHRMVTWPSANA